MAFERKITKQNGGSGGSEISYKNLNGEFEARLVYIVDLGMHRSEFKGEYKGDKQMITLGFEILGETVTVDGEEKPRYMFVKPFFVSPYGMSEKSNEFKYYSVFEPTAKDFDDPDWLAQLGKPCSVTISNKEVDGNTYDEIVAVTPIPKKYQKNVDEATIEPMAGDGADLEDKLYGLARWMWNNRIGANPQSSKKEEYSAKKDAQEQTDDDFDDDIPF